MLCAGVVLCLRCPRADRLWCALTLLCVFAALARMQHVRDAPWPADDLRQQLGAGARMLCDGVIRERPRFGLDTLRLLIETTQCRTDADAWIPRSGVVELRVPLDAASVVQLPAQLQRGALVRWWGQVRPVTQFRNPGTWQVGWRRIEAGVAVVATTRSPLHVQLRASAPWGWRTAIEQLAEQSMAALAARCGTAQKNLPPALAVRGDPVCGMLAALLLGDGDALPDASWDAYRATGLVHVLVVSGLHVVFVAWGLWWALRWCLRRAGWWHRSWGNEWLAAAWGLFALWSYIALVGEQIPAVRSAVMLSALFIARPLRRRADAASIFALVIIGIVLHNPWTLWSASFQLSCGAVAGLLVASPVLHRIARWPWPQRILTEAAGTTVVATWATAPILAYHFQQLSWISVGTNLLGVPISSIVLLPLGMLWLGGALIMPAWTAPAVDLLWQLLWNMSSACHAAVVACDRNAASTLLYYNPTLPECLLIWLGGGAVLALCAGWRPWRIVPARRVLASVTAILLLWTLQARALLPWTAPALRLTVLDVGQGSGALLQLPGGRAVLLDAGGIAGTDFPIGALVVVPALRALGVTRLDALVLSHYHPDHYLGLPDVIETFQPKVLYVNGSWGSDTSPGWLHTAARIVTSGIRIVPLARGDTLALDPAVQLRVLHPGPPQNLADTPENDRSLVLDLQFGAQHWWLPGDIESASEAQLLTQIHRAPLDLLLAPHHGSATSSTAPLLAELQPRVAAVSCGQWNRYRFPKPDVLARYAAIGSTVLRTDLHGAIQFATHGGAGDLSWKTFVEFTN